MRHYLDIPDLPIRAFKKRGFGQKLATLEGKGGGSQPAPPNPNVVANAQTQTNQDTAAYNKALNQNNYSNPFGSQSSAIVGADPKTGAPIYQTSITANPLLKTALNQQLGNVSSNAGLNQRLQSGLFGIGDQMAGLNASGSMKQGQDAYYNSAKSYLDPQFSEQEESLQASLANQGLTPGSEAYEHAMGDFNRNKDFTYGQAQNSAITQGQQLGLNQLSADSSLLGQRAGLFGQIGQIGQQPYSNLQTIAQLIPGYSGPATTGTNPADIAGAMDNQFQGQLAGYNANQATKNQQTQSTEQLGLMAAMLYSDRRLKKNIRKVGKWHNGLTVYSYRYIWESAGKHIGFMADEVRKIVPDAVVRTADGYDRVNYRLAGGIHG